MAVPKKKTTSSSTKRQRHSYKTKQQKKILGMIDTAKRNETGKAILESETTAKVAENITVVQA